MPQPLASWDDFLARYHRCRAGALPSTSRQATPRAPDVWYRLRLRSSTALDCLGFKGRAWTFLKGMGEYFSFMHSPGGEKVALLRPGAITRSRGTWCRLRVARNGRLMTLPLSIVHRFAVRTIQTTFDTPLASSYSPLSNGASIAIHV